MAMHLTDSSPVLEGNDSGGVLEEHDDLMERDTEPVLSPSGHHSQSSTVMPVLTVRGGGCRDVVFLVAFIAATAVTAAIGGLTYQARSSGLFAAVPIWLPTEAAQEQAWGMWVMASLSGALFGAIAIGIFVFGGSNVVQKTVTYVPFVAGAGLLGMAITAAAARQSVFWTLLITFLIAESVRWYMQRRERLKFVVVLIDVAEGVARRHLPLGIILLAGCIFQTVILVLFSWCFWQVVSMATDSVNWMLLIWFCFWLRWFTLIVKGVMRVVVSGTVIGMLHASTASALRSDGSSAPVPTAPSFYLKRALGPKLGPICLGALSGFCTPLLWQVLAIVRRLQKVRRCSSWATKLADRITAALRWSHKYTFAEISIAEGSWLETSARTWTAFQSKRLEAVVDDDCSDRVMLFCDYVAGCFTAAICWMLLNEDNKLWSVTLLLCFWYAFVGVSVATTLVEGSVMALFTRFAFNPTVLSQEYPLIYHRLCRIAEVHDFDGTRQEI